MKRTHVCLPEGVDDVVDELVIQSAATDAVPRMSKANIQRALLRYAVEDLLDGETDGSLFSGEHADVDEAALLELVPEHRRILAHREQYREGEAQLRNLRTGFEARWKRHFKNRFEGGIREGQLEAFAINAREDVRILYPDAEEHAERRAELLEWIDRVVEHAKLADDMSTFDPLDPSTMFDTYEGVEDGAAWDGMTREEFAEIVEEARRRLSRGRDKDALATALVNEHGIPEEVADNATQAAQRMVARGIERFDPDKLALEPADDTESDAGDDAGSGGDER